MRKVSNEFKECMKIGRKFFPYAEFTFSDGRKLNLGYGGIDDLMVSGNSFVESPELSTFPLGAALSKRITLSINNDKDQYADYNFLNAKIILYLKFHLSDTVESIRFGEFTITDPETYGSTIEVTAIDDMYKMDVPYSTNLTAPFTVSEGLIDSCNTCGVTLQTTVFENSNWEITEIPEGITHRQFAGYCAMFACGNAFMDEYNRLYIKPYQISDLDGEDILDGGYFDGATPYESGDDADGGIFNPWDIGYVFDAGLFTDMPDIHQFYSHANLTIDTDDVVITGIKIFDGDNEYIFGSEGYVLKIDNALVTTNYQEFVDLIGSAIVGMQFRPFAADEISYPLAEFMDICHVIDRNGKVYKSVITDIDFNFLGYTTLKCTADSPIRNSSEYYSQNTEAIVQARKAAQKELSSYEKAATQMMQLISQGFGMYFTIEVQEDGSEIPYLHDKPDISDSNVVWMLTSTGLMVSKDGGLSWGIDSNGNALFNTIIAHGISLDWLRSGTVILGGMNNESGKLIINDASGVQIGKWDKDGLVATKGTFSGALSGATGTFKGTLSAVTGTFASLYTGSHSSYASTSSGFYAGSEGISLGSAFSVTSTGSLSSKLGYIGKNQINENGIEIHGTSGLVVGNDAYIGMRDYQGKVFGIVRPYDFNNNPNVCYGAMGGNLYLGTYDTVNVICDRDFYATWAKIEYIQIDSGKVGTASITSSEKYKKDIEAYDGDALELISRSKIYQYRYKKDKNPVHRYGLIIERECPKEVISEFGDSIDLYSMCSFSWAAIRELSRKVDFLYEQTN